MFRTILTTAAATMLLGAPAWAEGHMASPAATATLKTADGAEVGSVQIFQTQDGVLIRLDGKDMPEGWHGFHLHQTGACEGPDFTSAGDHYAPNGHSHGLMAEGGPHAGDLPNVHVASDGSVMADVTSTVLSIEGGEAPIMDDDGSAFIIHENADSYAAHAGAGGRIACGVVEAAG